jgi:hypothetical protein
MAYYDTSRGPFAGPLQMNAMGRAPIGGGGAFGAPAEAMAGPGFATLPEDQRPAGAAGAGTDWLKLLQMSAPILQQLQQSDRNGAQRAMAGPALQAMPAGTASQGALLALLNRQPLMTQTSGALPGLLG